jgi:hypothetical protein
MHVPARSPVIVGRSLAGSARAWLELWVIAGVLVAAASPVAAQSPPDPSTISAVEGTVGNQVLQLRYLSQIPFAGVKGNLDYGALLSEDRDFIASAAMMFDTDIPVSRLRLQVGPELALSWLNAPQKTDVFAAAFGVGARYEVIPSIGLSVFGNGFYSPGVLTFGNAHNMYDFAAGGELRLGGNFYLLAGYRWLKFTLVNEPDDKVANEAFGGIRWTLK